jgi:hypothetical protein
LLSSAHAATKAHVITFGKWQVVKLPVEGEKKQVSEVRVRALFVDGRLKEYAVGAAHDVTDRIFVVQRALRVNDSLPQESTAPNRWVWQSGGWLVVDRVSGRTTLLKLAEFDSLLSSASWYRDYAAYCGFSGDRAQVYAVVVQIGHRKPLLRKLIEPGDDGCGVPVWERDPARVTFMLADSKKLTFSVRAGTADVTVDAAEEEDAE